MRQIFSVKTAPIQNPIHLLSTKFEFLMKEIIILSWNYFNQQQHLTNTNFPLPQKLRIKLEIFNIHTKILLHRIRNFYKISTFLNIKLDRNKAISIFYPTVELVKLSMRKDYVSSKFIKSNSNKFAYLIRRIYVNIKYMQHI